MARDIVNLTAESGRDIIDDDAEATLRLENTSATGTSLKLEATGGGVGLDINTTTGIGIDIDASSTGTGVDVLTGGVAAVLKSSATESNVVQLSKSIVGSVTVALLKITSSTASGALMEFGVVDKGVVSTASAGATVDFGIRVKIGDRYGWLPVYHDIA